MSIKKYIPNAITCCNLFCGCLAIVAAFNNHLVWTAYLVGIAAVLDFFDGFAARLLKVSGEMGKQLDSLADMVTFGVVPGVVMYLLLGMNMNYNRSIPTEDFPTTSSIDMFLPYLGFLITIFSALRLAKFNIDKRQTDSFIGLPTPANSILICSLPLITKFHLDEHGQYPNMLLNPYLLIGLTLVMSYLLVAELPLFALKFKNFGWENNKIRYLFLIVSMVLLILFKFIAIPVIIFLYIALSFINNTVNKSPK